ncbi:YdiY family protein [Rhodanobacter ginsengisoli]|uniref:YdiY family protein n=1 Tax=Rhodanobacter ginsengisoli TaxID=418646 RepID=A0ABW0QXU0_9GAMM
MKKTLLASLLLATIASSAVYAQDAAPDAASADSAASHGGWSGSGEFGFASSTGNSRSENVNAKLGLNQENEQWKNSFFLDGLRSKSQQKVVDAAGNTIKQFNTTANRYDGGASVGYKLDTRSYIVGAARYEHDDFGANLWQGIVSLGYGYIALKDDRNELSFEIGPGYKRYRPADIDMVINGVSVPQRQATQGEMVARGLVNYKYKLTSNTSFENTLLMEAGSKNTYLQNDAGLAVSMTRKLALKVGFQVRHNSDVLAGTRKTDTLTTTNLVYSF